MCNYWLIIYAVVNIVRGSFIHIDEHKFTSVGLYSEQYIDFDIRAQTTREIGKCATPQKSDDGAIIFWYILVYAKVYSLFIGVYSS